MDSEELSTFLLVAAPAAFPTDDLPDLGHEGSGERLILLQDLVEMHRQIADGKGTTLQTLGHESAQTETAGVVLHPPGLEGGILPVVTENQETRAL